MRTTLPDPAAASVLPFVEPPNRTALAAPVAGRFVTPENALASTTYDGLELADVTVKLAVLKLLKLSTIPSLELIEEDVTVIDAPFVADSVSPVNAVSASDPVPVQLPTSKICPWLSRSGWR
jgi:hypothetical protein